MLQHAQHVLGVQVFFAPASAAWAWDNIPMLPMTANRLQRSTSEHSDSPAMLLPQNAELVSIFTDERHGLFVQAQDGKQKKPILFKVTEPSSIPGPYRDRAPSACAKMAGLRTRTPHP